MTDPTPSAPTGLSEPRFRAAAIAGGVVWFILLFATGFTYELTVPARPPKPKQPDVRSATKFSADVDRNPDAWASYLNMDARTYGIGDVLAEDMMNVLRHRADESTYTLSADEGENEIETSGLRLRLLVQDVSGSHKRLMVLQIENTTDKPLAYRVDTRPSTGTQACAQKAHLKHNAVAIAPRDVEMRSECIYRRGWTLKIKGVETIELPPLSYHYVSRLDAAQIGLDKRVVRAHLPPVGKECRLILPAEVRNALDQDTSVWRDMIDFYARHRCDTYTFPVGYKAFETNQQVQLPAAGARR